MIKRTFQCTVCGTEFPATKTKGMTHIGHVKHMYCFKCKTTQPCVQTDVEGAGAKLGVTKWKRKSYL